MGSKVEAAARVTASNYQFLICDDPASILPEADNWDEDKLLRGYAGNASFRLIGTQADLNDHWIELFSSGVAPALQDWDRVICVHFLSRTSLIHIMSIFDDQPAISLKVRAGDYGVYICGNNLGVDQLSLGEVRETDDLAYSKRKDLEWYRVYMVPGVPSQTGRLSL